MPNGNERGSSEDRRRRLAFLFDRDGVDGIAVCVFCNVPLLPEDATVDRIIPRCRGGRYTRDNIRLACKPCQDEQGWMLAREMRRTRC